VISGHLGIAGLAMAAAGAVSGRIAPLNNVRVAVLVAASFAPDILDGLLALGGVCNPSGLYSHTLPILVLLAASAGGAAFLVTGRRLESALVASVVVLHAPADLITGRKLFWPGAELWGWRLYERPMADFMLEGLLATAGWWAMRRRAAAPPWTLAAITLVVALTVQGGFNVVGARFGIGFKPDACGVDAATNRTVR